ncbi:MAG: Smr/MutS family protein [Myxococcota bacterium]|nr:Smr/MutS family protein [Myxococcota bacterium]
MFGWFRRKQPATGPDDRVAAGDRDPAAPTNGDDDDGPDDGGYWMPDDTAPPLTDELDLHTFQPRDCADVVTEYVRAAQEAAMPAVRIIHGKGKGTLRRIVHGVLAKHPAVKAFRLADQKSGSWGATLAELHPPTDPPAEAAPAPPDPAPD